MRNRPDRSGPRLWVRLVALLAVPLTTLTAGAAVIALHRQRAAEQASAVEHSASELAQLVRLGYHVADESVAAAVPVASAAFGVSDRLQSRALGYDVAGRVRATRAAVDADLAGLPEQDWLTGFRAALGSIRSTVDTGRATLSDTVVYANAQQLVERQAQALARQLEKHTAELSGGNGIGARVQGLRLAYEALSAATVELPVYLVTFLPSNLAGRPVREAPSTYLAGLHSRYLMLIEALGQSQAATLPAWSAFTGDRSNVAFTRGVTEALARAGPVQDDGSGLLVAFLNGEKRTRLLRAVVEASIQDVERSSRAEATAARRSLLLAVLAAALVIGLSLLGAGQLARTVARPMKVLAARAREVSQGQLDPTPLPARGAREVVAVTAAVNDLVGNLHLLHEQADALAAGDLGHHSLATAVPGQLGASMQRSVERLSESLAARDDLELRLRHEATHDTLTGLLNRAAATVSLDGAVSRARRTGQQLVVLLLDIDDFAAVNRSHGHKVADELLLHCGQRFSRVTDDRLAVARLDSDEFVLVAETSDVDSALELADQALALVRAPLVIGDTALTVTASIGLAMTVDGNETTESLLRDATAAVRRAKAAGGDRVEVFDAELRRQLAEREIVERALRNALENDLLELHYQPVVTAGSGAVVGFEALCRWTDPVLGSIAPGWFVAVAEGSDLVLELDRWVLRTAARQLAAWDADRELPGLHLAVNVSGRHLLRGDIVADVSEALARAGVAPDRLVVELTETVLLTEPAAVARSLTGLRELGVRVAIDDFGTGYTSIGQLRQLPADILKVDRSLVSEVDSGPDSSLVNLVVQTAHTIGLTVVAEGVETPAQLAQLRLLGCDQVQGYLIGAPMPAAGTEPWLAAHRLRTDAQLPVAT